MASPLIAITTDLKDVAPYMWHATPAPYVTAVLDAADGIPLLVPSIGDRLDLHSLLDRVDGVLVTGSRSNVHPSSYGVEATEDHEPFDPARDATTLPLIRAALERGVPLLAICRGFQELNVALGGTITAAFQKNRGIENHDYPADGTLDDRFSIAHGVDVKDGSCLAALLGDASPEVNSLHTQALDRIADALTVEATHADGTIEAASVEGASAFALGVQWHPEYWAATDPASRRILSAFGDAARDHMNARTAPAVAAE